MECKFRTPISLALADPDYRTARPLVGNAGRIFAVLAGQPDNSEWRAAVCCAYDFIKAEGLGACFPAAMRKHRRGLYAAINVGLGYGKGQRAPAWMDNKEHTPMVNRLLAHQDINRLANFASCEFSLSTQFLLAYLS
jgi:hypothetical protein